MAAGPVIVERPKTDIDLHVGVALVALDQQLRMAIAHIDLPLTRTANRVKIQISLAQIELALQALIHRNGQRHDGMGIIRELEMNHAIVRSNTENVNVICRSLVRFVSHLNRNSQVFRIRLGMNNQPSVADAYVERDGSGKWPRNLQMARLEHIARLLLILALGNSYRV